MNILMKPPNWCHGGCGPKEVPDGYRLCPECQAGADILNRNALALAREELRRVTECNEAMREPMRKLREAVGMPAEGEGFVLDSVLGRMHSHELMHHKALERLQRTEVERDEAREARDNWAKQCNLASEAQADALNNVTRLQEEVDRLKQSMVDHFKRDHLAGDGPEIDRWKARVQELEAQIETARQLERQACAVEAETKRHAPMTPGGTCCECARWIAGTWPGESDDHADTCSAGKLEHEADYAIARCIRLRRSP